MPKLKFFKTHPNVVSPAFATDQSACFDLSFSNAGKRDYTGYNHYNKLFTREFKDGKLYIAPHDRIMIPTGLILDIPVGFSVRIHARSGLSLKKGIVLANSEGVIDSDYIEEVFVLMYNRSDNGIFIDNNDRIAQGELVRSEVYKIYELKEAPTQKTNRVGGMGSTGISTGQTA